jgi:UDP-N-acetylmuramyl pentapeptide phosphotransferase/UDP-N-acetylglucosamine-1-phosphate transferase
MVLGDMGPWAYALPLLVLTTIGVTWSANLFNFMGRLDGLATSETLFVAAA